MGKAFRPCSGRGGNLVTVIRFRRGDFCSGIQETTWRETQPRLSMLEAKTESTFNSDRGSSYENRPESPATSRLFHNIPQRFITLHKHGLINFAVFVDDDAYDGGLISSAGWTRIGSRRYLEDCSIANEGFASFDCRRAVRCRCERSRDDF